MVRVIFLTLVSSLAGATAPSAQTADDTIVVDVAHVTRSLAHKPTGVNVNFLTDADARRISGARPLQSALQELAAPHLRYPGGEKADTYFFAAPSTWPAASANAPQFCRCGPAQWPSSDARFGTGGNTPLRPLSFDAFMAISNAVGGQPVIVVAYDSAHAPAPKDGATPTLQQVKDHAVEWVRYANLTRGWKVKYWEIGNETDITPSAYGGRDPGVERYAADVIAFSQAMKAVDPTIKIGINALTQPRIDALLAQPGLGSAIDYLSVHTYPTYEWTAGYDTFRTGNPDLAGMVRQATACIAAAPALTETDKARIQIALTEFNAIDWAKNGWKNVNDLGHALVIFDLIGQNLSQPKLDFLQFWNTRWINNDSADPLNGPPPSINDALDRTNHLNPAGRALSIWGQFGEENLVSATADTTAIRSYATHTPSTKTTTVFLLNKQTMARTARVNLKQPTVQSSAQRWEFAGTSPEDFATTWSRQTAVAVKSGVVNLTLPALSITVLKLEGPAPKQETPARGSRYIRLKRGQAG